MPDDRDHRREPTRETHVDEHAADDVGHLVDREPGMAAERHRSLAALEQQARPLRRAHEARGPTSQARRPTRQQHAKDERHRGAEAERKAEDGAARERAAPELRLVRDESEPATPRPPATLTIVQPFGHHLLDLVCGADRDRAERRRVRIADAAIVHRDTEEAGGAQRLARRLELLEMTAQRFLALVDAMHGLESNGRRGRRARVRAERVEEVPTRATLVREMQEPAARVLIESIVLAQQRGHAGARQRGDPLRPPVVDLRILEEHPRALARRPRLR